MTAANDQPVPTLIRLDDTDLTITDPDEDVRGRKVIDRDGERLGKVTGLLVDEAAKHVRFLVVEHGGVLGIGAKESFLPVEAVSDLDADTVSVDTDLRAVAGAPPYDPDIGLQPDYYEGVYRHYGYSPSWESESHPLRFPHIGGGFQ